MREMPKLRFPDASLLAAMLGPEAPTDLRRAAQRLRAEGAPALAVEDEIAALAGGLALSEVSRSPAVPDALPPLFWIEARHGEGATRGWILEKRGGGLAARGFAIVHGPTALPEPAGTAALSFGGRAAEEDEEARTVRGLVAAIALPEMLSQMGESSPILLLPADPPAGDAAILRNLRLSVAVPPEAHPG